MTGGVGDEPLLFDQVAANENNLDWNPVSPLGLMLLGSMDTSTEMVDGNPVTVELSSGLDSGQVDESPLIGLSSDAFGYSEGIV